VLKSSGGNQIQVQPLNSGDDFWNGDSSQTSVTRTWSDGSPATSGSSAAQGVMTSFANGAGLTKTHLPASAELQRTVRIYWEGYSAQTRVKAHLSDGSASDLVYSHTTPAHALGGPQVAEFTYPAAGAKQTLQVDLVVEQMLARSRRTAGAREDPAGRQRASVGLRTKSASAAVAPSASSLATPRW
jgi:hypothetical protein